MTPDKDKAEALLASTIRQALDEQNTRLSGDVCQRLRQARVSALQNIGPAPQRASQLQLVGWSGKIMNVLGGPGDRRAGMFAMMAPLAVAIAVLLGSLLHGAPSHSNDDAAGVDTELLTDDLPPKAYVDPGFLAYLKSAGQAAETEATSQDDNESDGQHAPSAP